MTAGTISLDEIEYGSNKAFGVLGQNGINLKEYVDLYEQVKDIQRRIYKGQFEDLPEKEVLENRIKRILSNIREMKRGTGQSIVPESCSSSFILLSMVPNTIEDGEWNAKGKKSSISIGVSASPSDKNRPLTPDFL